MTCVCEVHNSVDVLLDAAPSPDQTTKVTEKSSDTGDSVPPQEPPPLHRRLCDEVVAKARLIGWSDAELERLSNCESDDELLTARERVSRELALRFSVPPLYAQSPEHPPQFRQIHQFK